MSTSFSERSPLKFLSTPSARRATREGRGQLILGGISIHALREEGDTPRPAAARATSYFYPRPPRGGRRRRSRPAVSAPRISIHALREEGDLAAALV